MVAAKLPAGSFQLAQTQEARIEHRAGGCNSANVATFHIGQSVAIKEFLINSKPAPEVQHT